MRLRSILAASLVALAAACTAKTGPAPSPPSATGPAPTLPAPQKGMLPTVQVAKAVGWPKGAAPVAPAGFTVSAYASGLDHPRWIYLLPNGDVLVAESSTEATKATDLLSLVANRVQDIAGAQHASANKIILLRDSNGDGVVDIKSTFLTGLNQPFGMALVGSTLYVANTDAVVSYPYKSGDTHIAAAGATVLKLPYYAPDNHHWTRSLVASPDGRKLYVSVGSASNVGEKGLAVEERRAAILEFDPDGGHARVFASGLRNPNGLSWEPRTGALWVVVNERDELGDNLVPDYLTSVKDGGFYGWPFSYFGQHVDDRIKPADRRPDLVARAIVPDYAVGAHTASLGLDFYQGGAFPDHYAGGAFIGQHGSWNRSVLAGYEVAFVPFRDGKPAGAMEDFLTGFVSSKGEARGRPVGVAEDRTGALLVADDVGDVVWRVAAAPAPPTKPVPAPQGPADQPPQTRQPPQPPAP
jgi:glucose/arabinose dehydrogenase